MLSVVAGILVRKGGHLVERKPAGRGVEAVSVAVSEPGRVLVGRYGLLRELGRGAMGVVWLARDELLSRDVAVKQLLLPHGLAQPATEQAAARAMREARLAARLHHPDAISVFDVVTEDGRPWLVMEYLPSRSLAEAMSDGPLSPGEAARIGARVAGALAAAHGLGIVHRDVKPANILLGEGSTVKITDFGIARASDDVKVTETGLMAGTPAYLAPEVARGDVPGPPSDVFSLGATLYAAVEGDPPFGLDDNHLALLNRVASGRYPPPRRAGRLAVVLDALLETDPKDRLSAPEAAVLLGEAADLLGAAQSPGSAQPSTGAASAGAPTAGFASAGDPTAGFASAGGPTAGATAASAAPTVVARDLQGAAAPATLAGGVTAGPVQASGSLPPTSVLPEGSASTLFDGPPPPPARRPRWERPAAAGAAAAILAALVAIVVSGGLRDDGDPPGSERVVTDAAQLNTSEVVEFVDDYFDDASENPEAAYRYLATDRRPEYGPYADFWDAYEDVDFASRPEVTRDGSAFTVDVRLELQRDDDEDGDVNDHQMRVEVRDGRLRITEGAVPEG